MKLLVLDGNSIVNRAYYGIRPLTTQEGIHTNGIYGFLTTLLKIEQDENPDGVAIAFDMRAPTFRHKMYSEYKGTRKGMPPELAEQMPLLKELLGYLGYNLIECEGYEADDILGTLSETCNRTGNSCILATGDRDSLQLVSEHTTVRLATTKMGQPLVTMYGIDEIKEKYGITPKQLIDIKAIQGDTSDNIPGVKGIGEKGAQNLIQTFGTLQNIYDNLETADLKPAMLKKLTEGRDSAFMSYELGKICCEAPIDTELSHYVKKPVDNSKASSLMTKLELFKLMERLSLSEAVATETDSETASLKAEYVDSNTCWEALSEKDNIGFTYTIDDNKVKLLALNCGDRILVTEPDDELLKKLFTSDISLYSHDVKPIYKLTDRLGIYPKHYCNDLMLCGYLLNPSASDYSIERLCSIYSVAGEADVSELPEEYKDSTEIKNAAKIGMLSEKLMSEINKNNQNELLKKIELPLALVLARMENIGFNVDADGIDSYGKMLDERISQLQADIYKLAGEEFNINSPKQLGVILFEKLGLPAGKKTKSGYSTSADILEKLKDESPIVASILEYRGLAKLKSTYCDGLLKQISTDGRIHSSFNQAETRTGRISSTEPNLQNIPVRTELGREMRKFFKAADGNVLVDADYSQIELRVLASLAGDKTMIEAFKSGLDIHTATASQVFGLPEPLVTPLMRSRAKAVNFGIVYGIGAFSLAKDINVTRKEADTYIKAYLDHYSGINGYLEKLISEATENGYAETLFGRRRYLPELTASNFNLRSFGQRVARNMPIQGTAADIIKIAMINVDKKLHDQIPDARLILQVHDELIVETPNEYAEQVRKLLTEEMEAAVNLAVPMVADANIGETWFDAKG